MSKIKDLLANREKLEKYDELKATLNSLKLIKDTFNKKDCKAFTSRVVVNGEYMPFGIYLTSSSLDAITVALDA